MLTAQCLTVHSRGWVLSLEIILTLLMTLWLVGCAVTTMVGRWCHSLAQLVMAEFRSAVPALLLPSYLGSCACSCRKETCSMRHDVETAMLALTTAGVRSECRQRWPGLQGLADRRLVRSARQLARPPALSMPLDTVPATSNLCRLSYGHCAHTIKPASAPLGHCRRQQAYPAVALDRPALECRPPAQVHGLGGSGPLRHILPAHDRGVLLPAGAEPDSLWLQGLRGMRGGYPGESPGSSYALG